MQTPARHRLQLVERHLAPAACLRMEFSLRLSAGRLHARPAPMFWVGAGYRDSSDDFARLHGLLGALACPPALLDSQRRHSPHALYQGVAIDLDSAHPRGVLFMHCRDTAGEQRLGLGWDGAALHRRDYRTGRLGDAGIHDWLLHAVHADYRPLFAALGSDPRIVGEGGYWIQRRDGRDDELYLTMPWHPRLEQLAPRLNAHLPTPLPATCVAYRNAPVRHIGMSLRHDPQPALTLYASAAHHGAWPRTRGELEAGVMAAPCHLVDAARHA